MIEQATTVKPRVVPRITWGQLRKLPLVPLAIIIIAVLMALLANFIAPHDPTDAALSIRLKPPVWHGEGSWTYPLGTDSVGRDILSRIIFGARSSLLIAAVTLLVGGAVGGVIGMVSGYVGGRTDAFLMRLADITIGMPMLLFALLLAVALGPSLTNVIAAISIVLWARFARVVRGEALSLRERDFVALARVAGCSPFRILLRHIAPNVANTMVVVTSLQLGFVIIVEATLSFLGAGIPPPTPVWGSMVAQGREFVTTAYWVPLMPGIAIMLVVLSFNLLGDWLRDNLDPTLRQL